MANKTRVFWVRPPKDLAQQVDAYGGKVQVAIKAVADFMATKMQNYSRQNAKWQDRTGNARTGLFGVTSQEAAKEVVTIYLSHGHTISYGVFLELANAGKYAIIWPAIEKHLPELKKMLDDIFR